MSFLCFNDALSAQQDYDHAFFQSVQKENLPQLRRSIGMGANLLTTNQHHQNALMAYLTRDKIDTSLVRLLVCEYQMDLEHVDIRMQNPVHYAARYNHLAALKLLLQWGANGDALSIYYQSPLGLAVQTGNIRMVHELLDWGADPNVMDVYGYTPLLYGVSTSYEMVKLLVESGARVNFFSSKIKHSPLSLAMKKKNHLVITYLRLKGARAVHPRSIYP